MTEKKKTVALVSASMQAARAMTRFLKKKLPEYKVVNYLDEYLLERISQEGHISDATMKRVLNMIESACKDKADVVLLTCTVFSAYQSVFRTLFQVPVYCVQGAMLCDTAEAKGKKAIICNEDGTVEATKKMYSGICRQMGVSDKIDFFVMPDPFLDDSTISESDWMIMVRNKVLELDAKYDCIAMAQTSMEAAVEGIKTKRATLLLSPECALQTLKASRSVPESIE